MNYEQRNAVVAIATNVIVSGYIFWQTWIMLNGAGAHSDEMITQWAQLALWAIPLSIVAAIAGSIIFHILYAIFTGNSNPSSVVDERDRHIGVFVMRVTIAIASAGFIMALGALALGLVSVWVALIIIFAGFALGDFAGNVTRLGYYWWGA